MNYIKWALPEANIPFWSNKMKKIYMKSKNSCKDGQNWSDCNIHSSLGVSSHGLLQ